MAPILEARDIRVTRGDRQVLSLTSLVVEEGQSLVVIGPNGAGKSTLLLTLSQLIRPSQGTILFKGRELNWKKTLDYRRQIGLVLQDPLLLNTTVAKNVAVGLRFHGIDRREIERRTSYWLERFGVSHLRDRASHKISGGEAQRVSLARAFAINPAILMLDEPFTALDAPSRSRLLADLQALISETRQTTLYITHDLDEARLMGDQIAVLLDGEIRQVASPEQVFSAPKDLDVGAFVGLESTVPGKVAASENGWTQVVVGDRLLEAVGEIEVGRDVFFCLRPEDVTLWSGDTLPQSSARNQVSGTVASLRPQGPLIHVAIDCGFPIAALITNASMKDMELAEGQWVTATFKASSVHLIPR